MELILERRYKLPTYTIGKLYIDGKYFCDTLEDKDRGLKQSMTLLEINRIKVKNETAIPTGTYDITLDVVSAKFSTKAAYKSIGGKLPRLLNVPGFEGILLHIGNSNKDCSGCILTGENKVKGRVVNSTVTFNKLYKKLLESKVKKEKITIKII